MKHHIIFTALFMISIISCKDDPSKPNTFDEFLILKLRMEVHVVDSVYHAYSIPKTKTFYFTFIEKNDGARMYEEYSDTTTCGNGWAVKELIYSLEKDDVIYLGATIKNPPKEKYQFSSINYDEVNNFANGSDTIRFIKTFSIYE